ncbi:uncharacterized protein LOC111683774 [Lucilia cuprina]|uniref:uncharacterized protein LOC111683774 n=1 Tax=Lucilia cuprina TaxID=7375 RepID=UPI001F063240|nr:uncharacterized protein LOC111683774 [Lucilia cuprina]
MKFVPLHATNTAIIYKNSICSAATLLVLTFLVLSVMIPVLLVSLLSPYSGIAESRVLYEQPQVQFKYQSIFLAETMKSAKQESEVFVCSTFPNLNNALANDDNDKCEGIKYWTDDLDYDGNVDRVYFVQHMESLKQKLISFDIALFFEASLKHKCSLSPPALLIHHIDLPLASQLTSGVIVVRADLMLKQYVEFTCPFPGRNTKTSFRNIKLNTNTSQTQQFQTENMWNQVKSNPAFFQLDLQETYVRKSPAEQGLTLQLDLDILQLGARYHLSIWERLGQFWLYFASFFGISFYIMNKVKDFLFGHHIVRSWEIIPWKKLY